VTATLGVAFAPESEAEIADAVASARREKLALDVVSGDTRRGLGRPSEGDARLSTAKLSGIVFYEPAEMTIRARAGTPLAAIDRALAEKGQMLPFEPMDHRALYGTEGEPTVGGLVAANASGPRRISAGAARDSLIGVKLVNGRGETISVGGRVMKNVTGLDLTKLVCGAHGTLGVVTEATFKLLPSPKAEASIVIRRLDDLSAVAAMTRALGSPYGVSGAAMLSPGMGREWSRAFIRVEGFLDSVRDRAEKLIALLAEFGARHALEGEDSRKLWRAIRDATYLAAPRERAVWRVSVRPSDGATFVKSLGAAARDHFYDWGGGLVWLSTDPTIEAASTVRSALARLSGHATLVRAPAELRRSVDVFQPSSAALARLTKGLKASFDPDGIFNRGRMYAGL